MPGEWGEVPPIGGFLGVIFGVVRPENDGKKTLPFIGVNSTRTTKMKRPTHFRSKETTKMENQLPPPTPEEMAEFKLLETVVQTGLQGYIEVGQALRKIHGKCLWRVGGFKSWKHYCKYVAEMSTAHANRLMRSSECAIQLAGDSVLEQKPKSESVVRPLLRLHDPDDRRAAWEAACHWAEDKDCLLTAKVVTMMVVALLEEVHGITKTKPEPQTAKHAEVLTRFVIAIMEKRPRKEFEALLDELEKLT
jgi:hypothetical protein